MECLNKPLYNDDNSNNDSCKVMMIKIIIIMIILIIMVTILENNKKDNIKERIPEIEQHKSNNRTVGAQFVNLEFDCNEPIQILDATNKCSLSI